MRRIAYPHGRYLLREESATSLGPKLKDFMEALGFPVIKFDTKNEGDGTLIIAVNRTIKRLFKEKTTPEHLEMLGRSFLPSRQAFQILDWKSQRAGIELYVWPAEVGVVLEVFVFPYMEHFNKVEKYHITQSKEEEMVDWYLCEHVWEDVMPRIVDEFGMEHLHHRP